MAFIPGNIYVGRPNKPQEYTQQTGLIQRAATGVGKNIPNAINRLVAGVVGVISHYPPAIVDLDTAIYIDGTCQCAANSYGVFNTPSGFSAVSQLAAESYGTFVQAEVLDGSGLSLATVLYTGGFILGQKYGIGTANWIKWSGIGTIDFTISKKNVAGERPLDWRGKVYSLKKLGERVVAYGAGGASFLIPSGNTYGLKTFHKVGIKGKAAVTGDESKHFFIDVNGKLWKVTDTIKLLDYSEYLSTLSSSVVMTYDALNNLVYMCDSIKGYVFDVVTESLGEGPINISSFGNQEGASYIGAPGASIANVPFEICTDIYDLGARTNKTIYSLEFGVDLTSGLYAAIDYRRNKAAAFVQTPWYLVSPHGRVFITAFGREFRFRAKVLAYEYFELDYIKIEGEINDY